MDIRKVHIKKLLKIVTNIYKFGNYKFLYMRISPNIRAEKFIELKILLQMEISAIFKKYQEIHNYSTNCLNSFFTFLYKIIYTINNSKYN